MGKHLKLGPPPAATRSKPGPRGSKPSTGEPFNDPKALLGRTVAHLERLLTSVEMALEAGEGNASLIRESSSLARAITCMAAEQRALEKMRLQFATSLELSEVMLFLRRLPEYERARVIAELRRSDTDRGSTLA